METVYSSAARKQLKALDRATANRIVGKIDDLAANPTRFANVKSIKGSEGQRLRIGDYRVVFTIDGDVLLVVKIGHRREVYR